MRRQILWTVGLLGSFAAVAFGGEVKGDLGPRLAAMPPNTWVNLGLPWKGGNEVPMCFDQAHRLFFKYGGCGDDTPPVNIKFPKGDSRHPNGYSNTCWAVDMAQGAWRMLRDYDASWPMDRPGNGCTRQYCYDSKRKVIWMYGSQSDGGGGFSTGDMASYDATSDKFTLANSKGKPEAAVSSSVGNTFAYDSIHDFLVMPRGKSTWIYKPADNAWEERKTPEAPGSQGQYGSLVFDVEAKRLVCAISYGTGKSSKERPPDTDTSLWIFSDQDKTFHEHGLATWTYDPEANKWERLALKAGAPQPSPRWRHGLTYDSKNKVVILVGGSTCTWGSDEKYYNDVWVLDTAKAVWTKMHPPAPHPAGNNSRDNRCCAYDEADNVVLWLPRQGTVWAYRYK